MAKKRKNPESTLPEQYKLGENSAQNQFPANEADLPESIPPAERDPMQPATTVQNQSYDANMVPEYSTRWEGVKAAYELASQELWSGRSKEEAAIADAQMKSKGKMMTVKEFKDRYPDVPAPSTDLLTEVAAYRVKRFKERSALEKVAAGAPNDALQIGLNVGAGLGAALTDPKELAFLIGSEAIFAGALAGAARFSKNLGSAGRIAMRIQEAAKSSNITARLGYHAITGAPTDIAQGVVQEVGAKNIEESLGNDYNVNNGFHNIALGAAFGFGFRSVLGEGARAAKNIIDSRLGPTIDMNKAFPENVVKINEINANRMAEGKAPVFDKLMQASVKEVDIPNHVVGGTAVHAVIPTGKAPEGTKVFIPIGTDGPMSLLDDLGDGVHATEEGAAHGFASRSFKEGASQVAEVDITGKNVLSLNDIPDRDTAIGDAFASLAEDLGIVEPIPMRELIGYLRDAIDNGDVPAERMTSLMGELKDAGVDVLVSETKNYNGVNVEPKNTFMFLDENSIEPSRVVPANELDVKSHLEQASRGDQWIDESQNISRDLGSEEVDRIIEEMKKIDLNDHDFGVESRKAVEEVLDLADELNKSGVIPENVLSRQKIEEMIANREQVQIGFKALFACHNVFDG